MRHQMALCDWEYARAIVGALSNFCVHVPQQKFWVRGACCPKNSWKPEMGASYYRDGAGLEQHMRRACRGQQAGWNRLNILLISTRRLVSKY